jgi:hypothetical protein
MRQQITKINLTSAVLWAAAILSGAILKAPTFYTIVLLPILAISSLVAVESLHRRTLACARSSS